MVDNVELNDAVEQVTANEAKLSVDGSKSTLDEGPALGLVMVHLQVGVVQVSDGN